MLQKMDEDFSDDDSFADPNYVGESDTKTDSICFLQPYLS